MRSIFSRPSGLWSHRFLLASAAWCAISTTASAAGDLQSIYAQAPGEAFMMASAEERPYLQASPYAARERAVEAERADAVRRHPMRFGNGGDLPALPRFDSNEGALGALGREAPVQMQQPAAPLEVSTPAPKAPEALPPVSAVIHDESEPVLPATLEQVTAPAVATPMAETPVVEAPVAAVPVKTKAEPKSFLSGITSLFGGSDDEKKQAAPAKQAIGEKKDGDSALVAPPSSLLSGTVSTDEKTSSALLPPPVSASLDSVVIEKRGGVSAAEEVKKTRQLVIPPEISNNAPKDLRENPHLEEPVTDRFSEEVDTSEPPVSLKTPPAAVIAAPAPIVAPEPVVEEEKAASAPVPMEAATPAEPVAELAAPAPVMPEPVAEAAPVEAVVESTEAVAPVAAAVAEEAPAKASGMLVTPMRHEVIMQQLPGMKPIKAVAPAEVPSVPAMQDELPDVTVPAAPVSLPQESKVDAPAEMMPQPSETPAQLVQMKESVKTVLPDSFMAAIETVPAVAPVEVVNQLTPETKQILDRIPEDIATPLPAPKKPKLEISRASNPDLEITKPEIKKHEAMGISIQVKRPTVNASDFLKIGYDALQAGDLEGAMMNYQTVLDAYPGNEDALIAVATIEHMQGNVEAARMHYRMVLERDSENRDVLNNFLVLVSEEAPEKAIGELTDLELKNPFFDSIPAQLATLYAHQGNMSAAVEKMMRAAELAPDNMNYRYNLAVILEHAGYKNEAAEAYSSLKSAAETGRQIPVDYSFVQERLTFLLSNQPS